MDDIKLAIASNLIRLRQSAGMTQAELGEKLSYSDKTISKWERAESAPDTIALKQISDIFGVTLDYMVNTHDEWEGDKKTHEKNLDEQNDNAQTDISKYRTITLIVLVGIFALTVLTFTIIWATGTLEWMVFIYMIPAMLITLLVLNSVWNKGKHNFYIVSALVMSIFVVVYLTLMSFNPWQIFIAFVPAEIVVILSFKLINKKNK